MAEAVDRRTMVVIFFVALALCALVTKSHVTGWNDGSRFATVDALTADRTFQIDGSPFAVGLGDEIRFRGRTYSDKPPLLAAIGAAVAFALAPLGITLRHTPATAIYLITLLTVGVSFAAGCCYAFAFQRLLGLAPRIAVAVAALTGTATLALPYATVLTNHVPCGAAALAACYHLYRARTSGALHVAAGGLLLGLCYAFDAAGAMVAIAAAVLLWGAPLRRWLLCAAAGVPVVALQLGYNLLISGSILPTVFNLGVWSDPSLPLHAESTQVLRAFSPAEYAGFIVSLLVGSRGLFAYTPLMLVAAYGFAVMWRAGEPVRRLAIAILAAAAVFFLAIVFLQNDAHAHNFGERRYVDLFFLLCVALGPALAAIRGAAAAAALSVVTAFSIAVALLGTIAPFAGGAGESGFAFGSAEFAALARRAPFQTALDVLLLILVTALVLRMVARALAVSRATAWVRPRA
jgi:hypothetical protein